MRDFVAFTGRSPTKWVAEEFGNVQAKAGAERPTLIRMTDNIPAPQVWPTLRARDARALIRFLVDVVGFDETAVYGGEGDTVHHAQLSWPLGGGIMLGSVRDDAWALQPGTFGAYVVADDIDRSLPAGHGRGRRDHPQAGGHRLRLPRVRASRSGGQPLVIWHLPRRTHPNGVS